MAWGDITLPTATWGNVAAPSDSYSDISAPSDAYAGIAYNYLVTTTYEKLVTLSLEYLRTCYPIMDWSTISPPTDVWSDI
jgi:hypothetical protein